MFSILRKELREGNRQALFGGSSFALSSSNPDPDPLLSSLIYNSSTVEELGKEESPSHKETSSLPQAVEETIERLRNLEELDLSRNQFEGRLQLCLGHLSSLRLLQLEENNLRGRIPASCSPTLFLLTCPT
ncbi:hypothetical protein SOVF_099300 isoform B [Spinacia oleracea]|nr:hypothetical protein SOVF_099300 isoform B [Spinacia oleracea]